MLIGADWDKDVRVSRWSKLNVRAAGGAPPPGSFRGSISGSFDRLPLLDSDLNPVRNHGRPRGEFPCRSSSGLAALAALRTTLSGIHPWIHPWILSEIFPDPFLRIPSGSSLSCLKCACCTELCTAQDPSLHLSVGIHSWTHQQIRLWISPWIFPWIRPWGSFPGSVPGPQRILPSPSGSKRARCTE